MGIDAIALLRIDSSSLPRDRIFRTLDDGVLVLTGTGFDEEPEELALALQEIVGEALEDHEDARGVLMIPDVAKPSGRTYAEVVEEIGEGGTWVQLEAEDAGQAMFGGVFATMMEAMQSPDIQRALGDARDALGSGDGGNDTVTSAQERMIALARTLSGAIAPGQEEAAEAEMRKMIARSGGALGREAPADLGAQLQSMMGDPDLKKMVEGLGAQLAADPEKMAVLQELLAGGTDDDDDTDPGTRN